MNVVKLADLSEKHGLTFETPHDGSEITAKFARTRSGRRNRRVVETFEVTSGAHVGTFDDHVMLQIFD